ncbi:hypothetical protein NKK48_00055 [Mesorhizobium sp. C386A]|uniref:hypothetical protein n=1 Tax=unclassified Mesorhizobium TaxID=325217 RepID=UPI0003CF1FE1|nr:hypothetical protein [Mesorhizobium sp. LNJC386A00]ESY28249.1 hypothetical protein X748_29745 [Mesorhizobium sp. LNJC386A00]
MEWTISIEGKSAHAASRDAVQERSAWLTVVRWTAPVMCSRTSAIRRRAICPGRNPYWKLMIAAQALRSDIVDAFRMIGKSRSQVIQIVDDQRLVVERHEALAGSNRSEPVLPRSLEPANIRMKNP